MDHTEVSKLFYLQRITSHPKGCWPREIDHRDPDQTLRYRKNVESDEEFIDVTRGLVSRVEGVVRQNMTVDIYEDYFTEQVMRSKAMTL